MAQPEREKRLTPRELEVMGMFSDGLDIKQVAHLLNISRLTVKKHRENAVRKMHVRNTTHAVATLLRRGEML